jgi:transcriptional regulator with XRE-family HTH domain
MAARPTADPEAEPNLLPQILKAIRKRRGLSAKATAQAMNMALRSYVHFESGRGRLNFAHVQRFAAATNSDHLAILVALEIRSPEFAIQCLENKGMMIVVQALKRFSAQPENDFSRLDARALILASKQFFDGLAKRIHEIDAYLEQWMSDPSLSGPLDDEDDADGEKD